MENSQKNSPVNFKTALVNTELGEKLAKFKILADFLSESLIYCYQTVYGSKKSTQEEYDIIECKYGEVKYIVDDTLEMLKTDLEKNKSEEAR